LTIRKWSYLFFTTLGWGVLSGLVAGLILITNHVGFVLSETSVAGLNWQTLLFVIFGSGMISVLSQMGFFAYLILRYFAIGLIKNKRIWEIMQLILVATAFFDVVYLRYQYFAKPGESWTIFLILPFILLVISAGVAFWKVKLTSISGFIPTLLFMFVVTLLEAVQALRLNSAPSYIFLMTPLIFCNAWQILILQKITRQIRN